MAYPSGSCGRLAVRGIQPLKNGDIPCIFPADQENDGDAFAPDCATAILHISRLLASLVPPMGRADRAADGRALGDEFEVTPSVSATISSHAIGFRISPGG